MGSFCLHIEWHRITPIDIYFVTTAALKSLSTWSGIDYPLPSSSNDMNGLERGSLAICLSNSTSIEPIALLIWPYSTPSMSCWTLRNLLSTFSQGETWMPISRQKYTPASLKYLYSETISRTSTSMNVTTHIINITSDCRQSMHILIKPILSLFYWLDWHNTSNNNSAQRPGTKNTSQLQITETTVQLIYHIERPYTTGIKLENYPCTTN